MLSRAIDMHTALKKPRDREWIHILLAFLKTYVNDRSTELVMSDVDIMEYIAGLVSALREAAENLDSGHWLRSYCMYLCGVTDRPNFQISFTLIIPRYQSASRVMPALARRKTVLPWK